MSLCPAGFHLPFSLSQTLSPARSANRMKRLGFGAKRAEVGAQPVSVLREKKHSKRKWSK